MKGGAWLAVVLAAVLATPSLAEAQRGPRGQRGARCDEAGPCCEQRAERRGPRAGPRAGEESPIVCLMEWSELDLSDSQRSSLRELAAQLEEKNAPLVQEMQGRMPGDSRSLSRAERRELMQSMAPLREQIHDNNEAALESVLEVLNDDQKEKVEKWMKNRRGPRGGQGRGGGPF